MPKIPEPVSKRGTKWVEAFLMLVRGETKTAAQKHIGCSESTFWPAMKEDNWEQYIADYRNDQAQDLTDQVREETRRVQMDGMRASRALQKAFEAKIGEYLSEEGLKELTIGLTRSGEEIKGTASVSDLQKLSQMAKTTTDLGYKATGLDTTEKMRIAQAGKTQIGVSVGFPEPGEAPPAIKMAEGREVEGSVPQSESLIENGFEHLNSPQDSDVEH